MPRSKFEVVPLSSKSHTSDNLVLYSDLFVLVQEPYKNNKKQDTTEANTTESLFKTKPLKILTQTILLLQKS